jgi:hypothetical protein
MARPKKTKSDKRGKPMSFRPASEAEEQAILEKVRASGLSQSEYLRQAVLKTRLVVRQSKTDFQTIHELNKIGVNLNQLVHGAHIHGRIPDSIPALCQKIEDLIMKAIEEEDNPL